jgi:hypothetical protein
MKTRRVNAVYAKVRNGGWKDKILSVLNEEKSCNNSSIKP